MASLNIRDFPPELLKALKVEAARRGVTLRELVIEALKLSDRADSSGFPIFSAEKARERK